MVNEQRNVIWSSSASNQLKKLYNYIKGDSIFNAEKVTQEIVTATKKLSTHPTRYPIDKYKLNNDGAFRAFHLHRYMISYQVTDQEIIIVRVRHSRMEPTKY